MYGIRVRNQQRDKIPDITARMRKKFSELYLFLSETHLPVSTNKRE